MIFLIYIFFFVIFFNGGHVESFWLVQFNCCFYFQVVNVNVSNVTLHVVFHWVGDAMDSLIAMILLMKKIVQIVHQRNFIVVIMFALIKIISAMELLIALMEETNVNAVSWIKLTLVILAWVKSTSIEAICLICLI